MKSEKANKKIDSILTKVNKKGTQLATIIDDLKELRAFALEEQDPRVTKVIRLCYEYIQEHDCFDITVQKEEDEEGNEHTLEPGTDAENMTYFLELIRHSNNKYNREELGEYRDILKEELY